MSSPPNNDDAGTIAADVAARLITVSPGAFDQLVREGLVPAGRPPSISSGRCRAGLSEIVGA